MDNEFEESKQNIRKEVAFKDNTVSVENLPYPTVLYPGHYGTFFGFKINNNSPTVICSCAKSAIENYIKLRMNDSVFLQASKYRKQFILCNMHFPRAFVDNFKNQSLPNDGHIINHILFEQKLCHECNKAIPRYKYCVEMYGGAFKQYLGWYINKQAYDFGIDPMATNILRDRCPQDILELIKLDFKETPKLYRDMILTKPKEAKELWKEYGRQKQQILNIIESEVRIKFGHKKVGEAWTSETILYNIICSLFPNNKILRHYRPDFLQGLELDIFIDELKIGIEYQGIQHFEAIECWGGDESLIELKQRDKKKKQICDTLHIPVIYFMYDEDLSNDIVIDKLKYCLK